MRWSLVCVCVCVCARACVCAGGGGGDRRPGAHELRAVGEPHTRAHGGRGSIRVQVCDFLDAPDGDCVSFVRCTHCSSSLLRV